MPFERRHRMPPRYRALSLSLFLSLSLSVCLSLCLSLSLPPSCAHVTRMHSHGYVRVKFTGLDAGRANTTVRISQNLSARDAAKARRRAKPTARGSQELPAQAIPSRLHAGKAGPARLAR